tara:strand:+ start:1443 stop:2057 length:615 start_codon:yes stop_codon:yes gene_type:complete
VDAVLVLNADYTLLEIISWQKAMSMLLAEKVRMVEAYADRFINTARLTFEFPAVVVRTKYVRPRRRVRFSRKNILARDAYTCQYCGLKPTRKGGAPDLEMLTIDHVIPRAKSQDGWVNPPWTTGKVRVTSWENILTACGPCNTRKADHSLKAVGMQYKKKPKAPTSMDIAWMTLFGYTIPDEWQLYLPEGSPWKNYWDGELSSD